MKTTENRQKLIGNKIREAREEAGMSQQELAEKIGFKTGTGISLIELGDRGIAIEGLEKIADALQKDIKFFLGRETDKVDIQFALRADKYLSSKDKDSIIQFINFIRNKKNA